MLEASTLLKALFSMHVPALQSHAFSILALLCIIYEAPVLDMQTMQDCQVRFCSLVCISSLISLLGAVVCDQDICGMAWTPEARHVHLVPEDMFEQTAHASHYASSPTLVCVGNTIVQ